MKFRNYFLFIVLACLGTEINGQRNPIIFTPSPNLLQTELVTPSFLQLQANPLPVYRVEIIDNRFDGLKLGFKPEYKKAPREIRLTMPLADAVKKIFAEGIELTDSSDRKLIVLIQDCWITYYATGKFNILKKNLVAELRYKIECFTSADTGYYPLKRFTGNIALTYDEDVTSHQLVDSMMHTLQAGIAGLKMDQKENPKNIIGESRLENYIINKKISVPKRIAYGVYASYDDFLSQKAITDSIDIIPYYDNNSRGVFGIHRNVVAAHLGVIKNGLVEPCSKYWGYFDGRFLFYNTGNGFFIRMFAVNGQFIFADLQQIALNTKKKSITSEAMIGKTTYDMIKDHGKTYHLFFQLNFEDGSLY